MHLIESPAHARALLHADPGSAIMPAVLLGKAAKPKLTGRDLAKAQLAAWDAVMPSIKPKGAKPGRRR